MNNFTATVTRGKNKGLTLIPHRYQEGCFVVSKGGNTLDYATKVTNADELENWVQRGYSIRMSAPGHSPSICMPKRKTKNITATVGRGKNKGLSLVPHRYEEGHFVVSKGGNTLDCAKKVTNADDLESWVQRGYGIRMSASGHSPSIFMPKSLQIKHI